MFWMHTSASALYFSRNFNQIWSENESRCVCVCGGSWGTLETWENAEGWDLFPLGSGDVITEWDSIMVYENMVMSVTVSHSWSEWFTCWSLDGPSSHRQEHTPNLECDVVYTHLSWWANNPKMQTDSSLTRRMAFTEK